MKENLQDDHLDDYVRKSFDGYEENPSPDFWCRLETHLPQPETPTLKAAQQSLNWALAAGLAIALLLAALFAGHYFYDGKLRELKVQQAEMMQALKENNEQIASLTEQLTKTETTQAIALPEIAETGKVAGQNFQKRHSSESTIRKNGASQPKTFDQKPETPSPLASRFGHGLPVFENPVFEKTTVAPPEKPLPGISNPFLGESLKTATIVRLPSNLNTLPRRFPSLFPFEKRGFQTPSAPIKPHRQPSGWYAGFQAMPNFAFEKWEEPEETPDPMPGGPGKKDKSALNRQSENSKGLDFKLVLGKKLNRRLALESGLGYRKIVRSASHELEFKVKDDKHGMGGGHHGHGPDDYYEFDYDLHTYGGSANVSIRAEQVDTSAHFGDDEKLGFKINTREEIRTLEIPLTLAYRFGNGRLTGVAKAGLLSQFVLGNQLEINGLGVDNNNFHPKPGHEPKPEFDSPRICSHNFLLAAGLEYKISKHLSLVAEPTFRGDFQIGISNPQPYVKRYSAGLNAGLNVNF